VSGAGGTADAVRLAVGTLTVLPVSPPRAVERRTAARAMALAPLVGLALAGLVAGPLAALSAGLPPDLAQAVRVPPLLLATLAVTALALLTRGLHLDGLADTADGLGSRRRAREALEVMRRSDIGPFGVTAVVLCLLLQVFALATLLARGTGPVALVAALVASRTLLPLLCTATFPPARSDGLGRLVAGTVGRGLAAGSALLGLVLLLGCAWLLTAVVGAGAGVGAGVGAGSSAAPGAGLVGAAVLGMAVGLGVAVHARNRLGGVTGDVYGAGVEVCFTTVLVLLACLPA
jgi:adenosylcobinamide-GDP ribazoletransferase